jgi:hypothetical protein
LRVTLRDVIQSNEMRFYTGAAATAVSTRARRVTLILALTRVEESATSRDLSLLFGALFSGWARANELATITFKQIPPKPKQVKFNRDGESFA